MTIREEIKHQSSTFVSKMSLHEKSKLLTRPMEKMASLFDAVSKDKSSILSGDCSPKKMSIANH